MGAGSADPLRWIVALGLLLGLIGLGGLLAFDLAAARERDLAAARVVAERQIDRLDDQISATLARIDQVLVQSTAEAVPLLSPAAGGHAARQRVRRWASLLPDGVGLVVRDAEGRAVAPVAVAADPAARALADRLRARPGDGLLLLLPVPGEQPGGICLGRAVLGPDGARLGLVEAWLPPGYFQRLLAGLALPPLATVTVFDEALRPVASRPVAGPEDGILRAALAREESGVGEIETVSPQDGVTRWHLFRRLDSLPYRVVIAQAPADFLAGWADKAILSTLIFAAFALVLLALLRLYLHYSEDRRSLFAQVFDSAREGILIADRAGRILAVNATFAAITGYPAADVVGRSLASLLDPEGSAGVWPALRAEGRWRGEVRARRRSGTLYPQWLSLSARRDRHRAVTHFIGVVSDISEVQQARRAAEDNQRRLEQAQTLAGLGWWEFEPATRRLVWSDTTFALFGRDPARFIPSPEEVAAAVDPDDLARLRACLDDESGSDDRDLLFRIRRPDGAIRHLQSRFRVAAGSDVTPKRLTGIVLDVTARESLFARIDLFRRIADASTQGLVIADAEGRVLFANAAVQTMSGYEPSALLARHYLSLIVNPDTGPAAEREAALTAGQGWTGVIELHRADGSTVPVYSNAGVVRDSLGRVQYLFDTFSDFTAEIARQRALATARDAAEAANRAKSAFLANMSHELRTPMNAILGFSQFMLMDATLTEVQRERVDAIFQAGNHLLALINDILDLARVESGRLDFVFGPVPVGPVLQECVDLVEPLARQRGIRIAVAAKGDPAARADRLRLRQVLVNLLSNAVKYNRPNGRVDIGLGLDDSGRIRVTVADTGPGIPPEKLSELFTPFNRLGAEFSGIEGTGIGLALTRRILEAMQGSVGVESRVGRGSLFWIDLPAAA